MNNNQTNTNIPQTVNTVTIRTIESVVNSCEKAIANSLPYQRGLSTKNYLRWIITEFKTSPALYGCTMQSFCSCIVQAAQLGLAFGKLLGQVYFIPFRNSKKNVIECQLIIGYKGLLELARRSGEIKGIHVGVVHAGDEFYYEFGLNPKLQHVPKDGTEITHVYAIAYLKNCFCQFDVMTKKEVDTIKQKVIGNVKNTTFSPWVTYYEEMAKKTVLRKLLKILPASTSITSAISLDELSEAGLEQPKIIEATNESKKKLTFMGAVKKLVGIEAMPEMPEEKRDDIPPQADIPHSQLNQISQVSYMRNNLANNLRAAVMVS